MTSRETMRVDVVIVGAGIAGLAAAIRLKQSADAAHLPLSVVVLEKGETVGAHVLSGAVLDLSPLDALLPGWREMGAPVEGPVTSSTMVYLTRRHGLVFPHVLLPPVFSNTGNHIVSLGRLCAWLGDQASALDIDILAGFAASDLLIDKTGAVAGVSVGGEGQDLDLFARYVLVADGAAGVLSRKAIARFGLDRASDPQHFGLGIKEIWEVAPQNHRPGHVEHHLGWPLDDRTGGGGFVYHAAQNRVLLGFVTHLNYANPKLSPFNEMQRWKTHPRVANLLVGATRIAAGARVLTEGGWPSVPELGFPGGALLGCAAGFMNVPAIKGATNAMWSGIGVADALFNALAAGRGNDLVAGLKEKVLAGPVGADLKPVRNVRPLLGFGTRIGMALAGIDLWSTALFGASPFGTLTDAKPDRACLQLQAGKGRLRYPAPDGVLSFDRAASLALASLAGSNDAQSHVSIADAALPRSGVAGDSGLVLNRLCPAGVFTMSEGKDGLRGLEIDARKCLHCMACTIKDPADAVVWTLPSGASGPRYRGM